jgi:hypothetical protein
VIGIFYMQYERTILKIEESLLSRRSLLMLYMFGIVGIPILLMLI